MISARTRKIMAMVLPPHEEEAPSDEDFGSDDSFRVDDHIEVSEHETDTEDDPQISDEDEREVLEEVNEISEVNVQSPPARKVSRKRKICRDENLIDDEEDSVLEDVEEEPNYFYGKKRCYTWSSEEPKSTKTPVRNLMKMKLPALRPNSKSLGKNPEIEEVWRLLFDEDIINEVVIWTNKKLEKMREKIKEKQSPNYKDTDVIEIEALIGLMMLCAIFKSGKEDLSSLFSAGPSGRPIFRGVMSLKRCLTLLLSLRFDDETTRKERSKTDPAAPISSLFYKFIDNCQKVFEIGNHACIDEMLVPFRGRCQFRIYMPNKPAKYGLKIMCLTDAHTSYLYNAYLYVGKDSDGQTLSPEERKLGKPTQSVIRLCKPIANSRRNVTADNWFSSLEVIRELEKMKLTYVGTLRSNKKEIPPEFKADKKRQVGSSLYGFSEEATLLSSVPKPNKAVILISSMHRSKYTDTSNNKPEIISFYNATKSGVDNLDKIIANYSPNRRSRRWPLTIFYNMIAVSLVNAGIVYASYDDTPVIKRFDFIHNLANVLIKKQLERRLRIPNLPDCLTKIVKEILGVEEQVPAGMREITDRLPKRKTCRYCSYEKRRQTAYKCIKCENPVCLECSKKVCNECAPSVI